MLRLLQRSVLARPKSGGRALRNARDSLLPGLPILDEVMARQHRLCTGMKTSNLATGKDLLWVYIATNRGKMDENERRDARANRSRRLLICSCRLHPYHGHTDRSGKYMVCFPKGEADRTSQLLLQGVKGPEYGAQFLWPTLQVRVRSTGCSSLSFSAGLGPDSVPSLREVSVMG